MKIFRIRYLGKYLGGLAIVMARTKKEAIEMVKNDPNTGDFVLVSIDEVTDDFTKSMVLTNRNGDW